MDWVVGLLTTNQLSCYICIISLDYNKNADTDYQVGYAHVYCKGDEERLEDCEVGNLTSHSCSYLGIALCLDGK